MFYSRHRKKSEAALNVAPLAWNECGGRPAGRPLANIGCWIDSFGTQTRIAQEFHADARIRVRADIVAAAVIDIEGRIARMPDLVRGDHRPGRGSRTRHVPNIFRGSLCQSRRRGAEDNDNGKRNLRIGEHGHLLARALKSPSRARLERTALYSIAAIHGLQRVSN